MSKQFILVLVLALITVVSWVGFEVYHQNKKTILPKVVQEQIAPLDSSLKVEVLEGLETKEKNVVGEALAF